MVFKVKFNVGDDWVNLGLGFVDLTCKSIWYKK